MSCDEDSPVKYTRVHPHQGIPLSHEKEPTTHHSTIRWISRAFLQKKKAISKHNCTVPFPFYNIERRRKDLCRGDEQICIKMVVTRVNLPVWYNCIEWNTVYPCQFPALDIILTVGYWGGLCKIQASLVAQLVKSLPAMWETWVQSLGWEDPLEKEMATHSNTLVWTIPWTEEPDRLPFVGSHRAGHDWMTNTSLSYVRYIYSYTYILSVLSWQLSIDLENIQK